MLEFRLRPTQDRLVACLWSKRTGHGEPNLLPFAAITDELRQRSRLLDAIVASCRSSRRASPRRCIQQPKALTPCWASIPANGEFAHHVDADQASVRGQLT